MYWPPRRKHELYGKWWGRCLRIFPSQLYFLLKLRCCSLKLFRIEEYLKAHRKLFNKFIRWIIIQELSLRALEWRCCAQSQECETSHQNLSKRQSKLRLCPDQNNNNKTKYLHTIYPSYPSKHALTHTPYINKNRGKKPSSRKYLKKKNWRNDDNNNKNEVRTGIRLRGQI